MKRFAKHYLTLAVLALVITASACSAAVIRVKPTGNDNNNGSSWALAKKTVYYALLDAYSGDEVWVAKGIYRKPRGDMDFYLRDGVAMYGGFNGTETSRNQRNWIANETVLTTYSQNGLDGSPTILYISSGTSANTIVDGFTIRGGGCGIYSRPLQGFSHHTNATIRNNKILMNDKNYFHPDWDKAGGGIDCIGNLTIHNNLILGNGRYGIRSVGASIISNNIIKANNGVGIYARGSISIDNISMEPSISPSANITIINNVISGNKGGIYCDYTFGLIANNTLTGNCGSIGGIHSHGSALQLKNNIIAYNTFGVRKSNSDPATSPQDSSIISHCNIYGNMKNWDYWGSNPTGVNGNISADPKLVKVSRGNIHIKTDSPCIDAGTTQVTIRNGDTVYEGDIADLGWKDIDGEARIQGVNVDIGADECNGTTPAEGDPVIIRVSPDGDDANDGSSWSAAKGTVQAGIEAAAIGGGEVWVKANEYYENITLLPYAHVYGGFSGIESDRSQRDSSLTTTLLYQSGGPTVLILAGYKPSMSTIDGFTIKDNKFGSGIYCQDGSANILSNTITGNRSNFGGGIYCLYSSSVIANNIIAGNLTSTAFRNWLHTPTPPHGGSPYQATGGGIFCMSAPDGKDGNPRIINNTVVNNLSVHGDTVDNTWEYQEGSGIYTAGSAVIYNNIFALNNISDTNIVGTPGITIGPGAAYNYNFLYYGSSDILFVQNGSWDDNGTTTGSSPMYDDIYTIGDFHLATGSPCINAGNQTECASFINQSGQIELYPDIDLQDRVSGGQVDIGADEYYAQTVETPTFSPDGGTYNANQSVTISCATANAGIRYTTDGSTPTLASPTIVSGGTVQISVNTTLKAKAWKTGYNPSAVKSADYILRVVTPGINPGSSSGNTSPINVTTSCTTSGATIRYTTNGIDPTPSSPIAPSSIAISTSTVLKVRAFKSGWDPSLVNSAHYGFVGTTVTASDATGVPGKAVTLRATLTGSDGRGIAGNELIFQVPGVVGGYEAITNTSGVASVSHTIPSGTAQGTYQWSVSLKNDSSVQDSANLIVSKIITAIAITPVSGFPGEKVILKATLTGAGKALFRKELKFYVNGFRVYGSDGGPILTNGQGIALVEYNINSSWSAPSTKQISVTYDGDTTYNGITQTGNLAITNTSDVKITVSNVSGAPGQIVSLKATAKNLSGVPISEKTLNFQVEGANYTGSAKTNSYGTASTSFTIPSTWPVGITRNIMVTLPEDARYNASTGEGVLTVIKVNTKVIAPNPTGRPGQQLKLGASLRDNLGNAVVGRQISFQVGTWTGTGTTNYRGYASVDYPISPSAIGKLTVKVSFTGDSAYYSSQSTGYLTISMSKIATSIYVPNATGAPGQTITVRAYISNGEGKTLMFSYKGTQKTAVTDECGWAWVEYIIPSDGTYGAGRLDVTYAGDENYEASSNYGMLYSKAGPPIMVDTVVEYLGYVEGINGQPGYVMARLSAPLEAALPGMEIVFVSGIPNLVDGDHRGTAITDAYGYARLPYTLPSGWSAPNITAAIFAGRNQYKASSSYQEPAPPPPPGSNDPPLP